MPIYKLQRTPGAWPLGRYTPSPIIWEPYCHEETEGMWRLQEVRVLESLAVTKAVAAFFDWDEMVTEQLGRTQDDCGPVAMKINKKKRASLDRCRSSSQPPALYRRITEHQGWSNGGWSSVFTATHRRWLPPFHLCPYDMSTRFDCSTQHPLSFGFTKCFSLRDCCQGISIIASYVEDITAWKPYC